MVTKVPQIEVDGESHRHLEQRSTLIVRGLFGPCLIEEL